MTNREKYIDNASNGDLARMVSMLKYSCQYCPAYKECRKYGPLSYEEWIGECEERFLKWLSQEAEEDKERISCNVCKYAVSNGYHSSFMHHHICMNPKSARYNKGVDVVNDGCDEGEVKEAEEDIVNIPNIGKMPKTDKIISDYEKPEIIQITEKEYKETKLRLRRFERQLQKLTDKYKTLEKEHKDLMHNQLWLDEELDKIKKFNLCTTKILESHNLNYTKDKTADEMFEELGYEKNDYGKYCWSKYEDFDRYEIVIFVEWIGEKYEHITFGKYRRDKKVNFNFEGYITEVEDKAIHKKIAELRLANENHIVGDIVDGKVLCGDGIWREYNR